MSAHVLLNLLNELGKKDKMRGSPNVRFYLSYDEYSEISFLAYKRYTFVIMIATLLWTS